MEELRVYAGQRARLVMFVRSCGAPMTLAAVLRTPGPSSLAPLKAAAVKRPRKGSRHHLPGQCTSMGEVHDASTESAGGTGAREPQGEEEAAQMIQRNYRGYRERRQLKGIGLDASARWAEAVRDG
ncbi:hypothetical protein BDU57DRAFT_369154 [Ampelomyces quisqualis]|uniref:Uncharacterized protein n=1 Tax=Ampelomyces quisqualis TaxID=50730 RepID=A0A6A5QEB5_AMPQU|nr:hypothetical protein BDU57DRAFT_369154 [Ampelomyces quisqualis]